MRRAIGRRAELSMSVIVMAVLALVVLIVLIYIFTKSSQRSSSTFASCGLNGGSCVDSTQCTGARYQLSGDFPDCKKENKVCCSRSDWLTDSAAK